METPVNRLLYSRLPDNLKSIWVLFGVTALMASVHRLLLGEGYFNNYVIFEQSFGHLLEEKDLYAAYPNDHYDLFKYSPAFALFMAPFHYLPHAVGVTLWNLLNMLLPVWAISRLKIEGRDKVFILLVIFIELLTSVQNSQSNGIMAGLMIGAFTYFEEGKPGKAVLLVCLGFYVKLFAAVAGLLFLFYQDKLKSVLWAGVFLIVFAAAPALVCGFDNLIFQYKSWFTLVANDPAHELNFSIMTFCERVFAVHAKDSVYLLPGVALLMLPFIRKGQYTHYSFRLLVVAGMLIWVVIFNHKAESPTFVIAMSGIALWWITTKRDKLSTGMLVFALVLTSLSSTDLFPASWRNEFIKPYSLKALPSILIWLLLTARLLMKDFPTSPGPSEQR